MSGKLRETSTQSRTSDQIIEGLRRRTLLAPAVVIALSLGLLTLLLAFMSPILAYAVVIIAAVLLTGLFAGSVDGMINDLQRSLGRTNQRNLMLADRERTNREVADEAIQSLYGAALRLDSTLDRLQDETGVREDVDAAAESLTEVIGQIRRYLLELQPLPTEPQRLIPVHEWADLLEVGSGNE
jgi:hypothetical protein